MTDNVLYEALGISRNASNQQINQAYLKSIQESQNNPEKVELINVSYQILTNPRFRQIYDSKGLDGLNEIEIDDESENSNIQTEQNSRYFDDFYQKENEEKNEQNTIDNLLYDTLKIKRNATLADIQNAYEREYILLTSSVDSLMQIDLQKIQLLNAAYNVLTNPEIRKVYDKSGIAGVNRMQEEIAESEKRQQKYSDDILYEILGVSRLAENEEIRVAYLNLLKNSDYNDKEKIKMIHSAYSVLSVPKIRMVYDNEGIEGINRNFKSIHIDKKYFKNNENKLNPNSVDDENYENLLYETLGVERDASISQIKFAYSRKMKAVMQKYGCIDDTSEEVQLIKASYNVLSNPRLRDVYDRGGIAGINQLQSEESQNNSNIIDDLNNSNRNDNSNRKDNLYNSNNNDNLYNSNSNDNSNNSPTNNDKTTLNSNVSNSSESVCIDNILYDAICIKRDASFIEIQMSFLKKLNETVNDDNSEQSQLLHAAYNVLSDPELRKIYDIGGIGAINKVYEERARKSQQKQQQQKVEDDKEVPKEEIFVTQPKSGASNLVDYDSDSGGSIEEKDPFQISDEKDIISSSTLNGNSDKEKEENKSTKEEGNDDDNVDDNDNVDDDEQKLSSSFENLELTLEQLYSGCFISKTVLVEVNCPHCKGTGNEYGTPFPKCPACNGLGQIIEKIEKPADFLTSKSSRVLDQKKTFDMKRICEKCMGRGELRTDYSICCVCYALKKFKTDFQVDIHIHPGTCEGEIIKIPLKVDESHNEVKYVYLKIIQKKHDLYEKVGNDLIYHKKISLVQSLCGNLQFPIVTLDKRIIIVNCDENIVIQPNSSFVIKNEGFPIKNVNNYSFQKGDLIVRFSVDLPSVFTLGPKAVNMIKAIQPLKDTQMTYDRSKILKEKLFFYELPYEYFS